MLDNLPANFYQQIRECDAPKRILLTLRLLTRRVNPASLGRVGAKRDSDVHAGL
jgi:hypothetical protein